MVVIQVIGLPGAGKTTGIRQFLETMPPGSIDYIDLADFKPPHKHIDFRKAIYRSNKPVIAESASGLPSIPSYTIHVDPPLDTVYDQLLERDGVLDEDYLSLLHSRMTGADMKVGSANQLSEALAEKLSNNA